MINKEKLKREILRQLELCIDPETEKLDKWDFENQLDWVISDVIDDHEREIEGRIKVACENIADSLADTILEGYGY